MIFAHVEPALSGWPAAFVWVTLYICATIGFVELLKFWRRK